MLAFGRLNRVERVLAGKCLLDIDHLTSAGLHKAAPMPAGILQALRSPDHSTLFQIALITSYDLDGRRHAHPKARRTVSQFLSQAVILFGSLFSLDLNHIHEVIEGVQAVLIGNIIDQQESI